MTNSTNPFEPLMEIYQHEEVKKTIRSAHELVGFLCCIAASPKPLALDKWFPNLWKDGIDPSFADEMLAVDFATAALASYECCLFSYREFSHLFLPTNDWIDTDANPTEQASLFAAGYLSAFTLTESHWQNLNLTPDSNTDKLLQTTMLLLSKMASPNTIDPEMKALFDELPDMPDIIDILAQLLTTLGNVSVSIDDDDE